MLISKDILENMRRVVIQLLNLLDDALGYCRTVPSKEERRRLRQLDK
jgi:hypothetical protein